MKYLKVIYLSAIVTVLSVLTFTRAYAVAFQSIGDAASYDMFLPADATYDEPTPSQDDAHVTTPKTDNASDSESYIGSQTIDYNREIANHLFGISDHPQGQIVNADSSAKRVFVPFGDKLRVVLQEEHNQRWHVECQEGIRLLSYTRNGNTLELIFETTEKGNTKIYFDCVDKSNNQFRVIKSKCIKVIIG